MRYTAAVVKGHGRGKGMGFPTLNLAIPPEMKEEDGIYAGFVWIGGSGYRGAFHFGPVPTFKEETSSLEVFILDAIIEQSPERLDFELVKKIRDIETFKSAEELARKIEADVRAVRELPLP